MSDFSTLFQLSPFALIGLFTGISLLLVLCVTDVSWLLSNGLSRVFKTPPQLEAQQTACEKTHTAKALDPQKKLMPTSAKPFAIAGTCFLGLMLLGACGSNSAPAKKPVATASVLSTSGDFAEHVAALPDGNADNGAKLYTAKGCVACHSLEDGKKVVGPSFYGLNKTAAKRVSGLDAKSYIYQSIVAPNAYVVEGYQAGVMPQNYAKELTPKDMADLLAWIERDNNQ